MKSSDTPIESASELGRLRQDNLRLVDIVARQQAELKRFYDALAVSPRKQFKLPRKTLRSSK